METEFLSVGQWNRSIGAWHWWGSQVYVEADFFIFKAFSDKANGCFSIMIWTRVCSSTGIDSSGSFSDFIGMPAACMFAVMLAMPVDEIVSRVWGGYMATFVDGEEYSYKT